MQDLFSIINCLWTIDGFMKQQRLIEETEFIFIALNRKFIAQQGATGVEKPLVGSHKP